MKKILTLSVTAVVLLMLASCGGTYTYSEMTARYVEPQRAGFITPVVADMEVQPQKIENTVELEVVLKKRQIQAIMSAEMRGVESPIVLSWKKAALAETAKKYNADDIVSPLFEIQPSRDKEHVLVVKVTGHPAIYKNYRSATKEDVELMRPFIEEGRKFDVESKLSIIK